MLLASMDDDPRTMAKLTKAQLLNAHLSEADPEVFDIIEKVRGQDNWRGARFLCQDRRRRDSGPSST
jgi:hypothetical protein